MNFRSSALALASCAFLLPTPGQAQDPGAPVFAAPRRLEIHGSFHGHGRRYPSPVLFDIDGDERADLVIGDLFGKVTVAQGKGQGVFGAEKALLDRDGQPLKFHNW